jgi:hypothetical protein
MFLKNKISTSIIRHITYENSRRIVKNFFLVLCKYECKNKDIPLLKHHDFELKTP